MEGAKNIVAEATWWSSGPLGIKRLYFVLDAFKLFEFFRCIPSYHLGGTKLLQIIFETKTIASFD